MPVLGERVTTFEDFAKADLAELYGETVLAGAIHLQVTEARSGVFLNDGTGSFAFAPLPDHAQLSPVMTMAASDLNGDGHIDLVVGQNFFGPQRESGRMDGGQSVILINKGDASFRALAPSESGFSLPGEVRDIDIRDLNGDDLSDIVLSVQGQPVRVFLATP